LSPKAEELFRPSLTYDIRGVTQTALMGSVAGESRYWRIASDEGTNSWAVLRPSANLLSIVAADNDSIFKNGFD